MLLYRKQTSILTSNLKLLNIVVALSRSSPRRQFKDSLGFYQLATLKSRSRIDCLSNATLRTRSPLPQTITFGGNSARRAYLSQLRDLSPPLGLS